jgi:hypothetical protein
MRDVVMRDVVMRDVVIMKSSERLWFWHFRICTANIVWCSLGQSQYPGNASVSANPFAVSPTRVTAAFRWFRQLSVGRL